MVFTKTEKLPKYLTQDQVRRFLYVTRDSKRDRALFTLIYQYGLRVSEAVGLREDDIDLERGRIYVRRVKGSVSGEKPLWKDTQKILKSYLKERKPLKKDDFLFVSKGRRSITTRRVSQLFKQYLKMAGLDPSRWGIHSLRHSIAVHILDAGQPLEFVKDHLGHKSMKNTEIYARISDPRRQEIFNQLEKSPAIIRL